MNKLDSLTLEELAKYLHSGSLKKTNTVESHKFQVLGTRGFNLNYQ